MPERLYYFYIETYDRMAEPDLSEHCITFPHTFLYYLPVPEELLPVNDGLLVDVFIEFDRVNVLFDR